MCRILYSGSWDCSVRLWNKATLRREALLAFPDWVHQAKPCGTSLLVSLSRITKCVPILIDLGFQSCKL